MTDGGWTSTILWEVSWILPSSIWSRMVTEWSVLELESSLLHRHYLKALKAQMSCRHYWRASIICLQGGSVSIVLCECWSMVQTSHIKRYFSDLVQSNDVIWSTAKIPFVSLDLIPSHFFGACKCHFTNNYFLHLIYPDFFAQSLSDIRQKPFYGEYRADPAQ